MKSIAVVVCGKKTTFSGEELELIALGGLVVHSSEAFLDGLNGYKDS